MLHSQQMGEPTMNSVPSNAEQRPVNPLQSLREVTDSLRKRNDSLELHLRETGWLPRPRDVQKPAPQSNQRPPR